jgi:hypothetical protein
VSLKHLSDKEQERVECALAVSILPSQVISQPRIYNVIISSLPSAALIFKLGLKPYPPRPGTPTRSWLPFLRKKKRRRIILKMKKLDECSTVQDLEDLSQHKQRYFIAR